MQTVEAYNIGDGALALGLASSVPWISPAVGAPRNCLHTTRAHTCLPLLFTLDTASLSAGTYTGIVTVGDPNAVDAPQTITVTVRVGAIDLYVNPGSTRETGFYMNSLANVRATTQDGSAWLAVSLDGTGSFRFSYPYMVRMSPAAAMAAGTYSGSVSASGAATQADNQTIPVSMRVTPQPIAQATPQQVTVTLAEGAPPLLYPFSPILAIDDVSSAGGLSVDGVSTGGEAWLKTDLVPNPNGYTKAWGILSIDPKGLAPGTQSATLTVNSNGADSALKVPLTLRIVPKGNPVVAAALDNATFEPFDTVSPGDVMVVKGDQLSFEPYASGPAPPLATTLGGARVLVNGVAAPIFYSSYGQIAFQLPADVPTGQSIVQVERDGNMLSNKVSVEVKARAPKVLRIGVKDFGAIVNAADNSYPMPPGAIPGANTHPAKPGDVLVIYAIGLGLTDPWPATGQPAPSSEPLARMVAKPRVNFGGGLLGAIATPDFAGLTPTYAGLYQINVRIPDNTPRGIVDLTVAFPDFVSNAVKIAIE